MATKWVPLTTDGNSSEDGSPTWGDYLKTLTTIGGTEVVSALPAATRYLSDKFASDTDFGKLLSATSAATEAGLHHFSEDQIKSLSPAAKRNLLAPIGSEDFYAHPISSSLLKITRMTPGTLAIAGSLLTGAPAILALGTAGGALASAQTIDEAYHQIDDMSDAELVKNSDYYAGIRAKGTSEGDARKQIAQIMLGAKPALMFAVGAVAGNIGVPGQAARLATGAMEKGIVKGAIREGAVGATAGGAQSGIGAAVNEQGQIDAGFKKDVDPSAIIQAALEGTLLGGVTGGGLGGLGGIRGKKAKAVPEPDDTVVDTTDTGAIVPPADTVVTVPPSVATATAPNSPGVPTTPKPKKVYSKKKSAADTVVVSPSPELEVVGPGNTPSADIAAATTAAGKEAPVEAPVTPPAPIREAVQPVPEVAPTEVAPKTVPSQEAAKPLSSIEEYQAGQKTNEEAAISAAVDKINNTRTGNDIRKIAAEGWNVNEIAHQFEGRLPHEVIRRVIATKPDEIAAPTERAAPVGEDALPPTSSVEMGQEPAVSTKAEVFKPRVLPDLTKVDEAKSATKENTRQVKENVQAIVESEAPPTEGTDLARRSAKSKERATLVNNVADELFAARGDEHSTIPVSRDARITLYGKVKDIVVKAKERVGNIPERIKDNSLFNDKALWLREAEDFVNSVKRTDEAPTVDAATRYIARTVAIAKGEVKDVLSERRAEGEVKSRVDQGDVEATPTPTSGTALGKDDITTTVAASSIKKPIVTERVEETERVRPVKKVELTDEIKARALAALEQATNKNKSSEAPKPKPVTKGEELKEKAKTKAQEGKQKLKEEVAKVEPNPTEAQKASGIYPKGHVRILSNDVAIETVKGGIRRGKNPDGTEWESKQEAHYGHILGTKGADGDPIDIILGPKAHPGNPELDTMPVFVLDQQHVTTDGKPTGFDEHKVLAGFDTIKEAADAYARPFTDGHGIARISDIRVMSPAEFKDWLANHKPKAPAGEDVSEILDAIPDRGWDEVDGGPNKTGPDPETYYPNDETWIDHVQRDAIVKTTVSSAANYAKQNLEELATSIRAGLIGDFLSSDLATKLLPKMFDRIMGLVHDVPVYVLRDADYLRSQGGQNSGGVYSASKHVILIPERVLNSATRLDGSLIFARTILHEATHAAFTNTIWTTPSVRANVERIAARARAYSEETGDQSVNQRTYAFENVDEFVAEAFSNPEFQDYLSKIPAGDSLSAGITANRVRSVGKKITTLWDQLVATVGNIFSSRGITKPEHTLLDAMMHVGANMEFVADTFGLNRATSDSALRTRHEELGRQRKLTKIWNKESFWGDEGATNFQRGVIDEINQKIFRAPEMQDQRGKPSLLNFTTMDYIARTADRFFTKGSNPVRKVADLIEQIRSTGTKYFNASLPIIKKMDMLERKYKGPVWDTFTGLVHDETMANVFADKELKDQPHLGKKRLDTVWNKAQHPRLAAVWKTLPQDLKDLRTEAMKHFSDTQNKMVHGIISNRVLVALGIRDKGLADRIYNDATTSADVKAVGGQSMMDSIIEAKSLAKIDGPYFPLMRRGDHVVQAKYKIAEPSVTMVSNGAKKVEDGLYTFTDRKDAEAFASKQDGIHTTIDTVHVDKTTGKSYVTDAMGNEVRITSSDPNSERLYRVSIQDKYVDFTNGAREARTLAQALADDGLDVKGVEEKRWETPLDGEFQPWQMRRLLAGLENRKGYKDLPEQQKNEIKQSINQLSLNLLGSTRIQSSRMPRRYVAGFSKDLTQNTLDYSKSSSGYLAKLDHQPAMDAALKELDEQAKSDYGKDDTSISRSSIRNIVRKRLADNNGFEEGSKLAPIVNRILAWSFIDKLASPAYSIMNATQVTMLTYPVLAARHGPGRAFAELARAYSDIGAGGVTMKGIKATVRKAINPNGDEPTFLEGIKKGLKKNEATLIDYLVDRGVIDPEGGMELGQILASRRNSTLLSQTGAKLDQGIGYLEGISRQMPKAVEAINRTVSALAAYRLELAKNGGDHQKAMIHAQDTVNGTQFNYSATNAPPVFNHPLARLSFQFKKFALGIYQLIGENIGKAIHNENPGDRAEAVRALAYIAGTHILAAGTLGLPTEPIKMLVMAAGAVGVPINWQDVEQWERQAASKMFGNTAGEMLTRGVTRGLPGGFAFDLSGRLGLDSLLTYKQPESNKADDVNTWLADTLGGAPWSLKTDWMKGSQAVASGNFEQGMELLFPVKTFTDLLKAYRVGSEGKKSGSGHETMSGYNIPEALVQGIGLRPGREAEASDNNNAYFRAQKGDTAERTDFLQQWMEANGSERSKLWGKIEGWNKGKSKDARITRDQLETYRKRRATEDKNGLYKGGLRVGKREKAMFEQVTGPYND